MKTTTLVAVLTASLMGMTLASPPPAPGDESTPLVRGIAKLLEVANRMNLDNAQREAIRAVLKKDAPDLMPLVRKLVSERRTLTDVIRKVPTDEPAIRAQSAKVAGVESDLAVKRARVSSEVRAVLRPEQIAEFEKIQGEFRARVDERLSQVGSTLDSE